MHETKVFAFLSLGELELENVPLKKNIFRSWGLPIEVRSGVVGRIKIEFNLLKYLRNEPVLVSIEDIYLVAGPLNLSEVSNVARSLHMDISLFYGFANNSKDNNNNHEYLTFSGIRCRKKLWLMKLK
jgi:hypothetical protein